MDYKKLGDTENLIKIARLFARPFLLILIFAHIFALLLSNLPTSPFTQILWPYYSWYPRLTNQIQGGWPMYSRPSHEDNFYQIRAILSDHSIRLPLGSQNQWNSRFLYFIEGIFSNSNGEAYGDALLDHIYEMYPEIGKPVLISIEKYARLIPESGKVATSTQFVFVKQFEKK